MRSWDDLKPCFPTQTHHCIQTYFFRMDKYYNGSFSVLLSCKKKNIYIFLPSCVSFLRLPPFCFMYNVNDTVLFSSQMCSPPIHSLSFPFIVSTSLAPFCSYLWSVATLEIWAYVSVRMRGCMFVCVCVVQMCEEAHPTHKRARGSIPIAENNNVCTHKWAAACA